MHKIKLTNLFDTSQARINIQIQHYNDEEEHESWIGCNGDNMPATTSKCSGHNTLQVKPMSVGLTVLSSLDVVKSSSCCTISHPLHMSSVIAM
jgi:hypothetical protein